SVGPVGQVPQVFHHPPGEISGRHAHMEAILYVLEGKGYTEVDGEKVPWETGSSIHVPGPQTMHQHFTGGTVECRHLRIHFGIRANFYQPIAKKKFPYQFFETRKVKSEP
ncbi:MAG: cupin domain-containing protein, partial [Thaumarchaeota archaeon]|nr:cupin domain-containing protein [Nitrososphaerota archaeon]